MCKIGQSWFQAAVLTLTSNSLNSTINSNNSSNSTTNSTNSSNSTSGSNKMVLDIEPRGTDILVFTKISSFSSFLKSVVGSFPPSTIASNSNSTSLSSGSVVMSSSLSVASVLTLLALIQMFGLE